MPTKTKKTIKDTTEEVVNENELLLPELKKLRKLITTYFEWQVLKRNYEEHPKKTNLTSVKAYKKLKKFENKIINS